MGYSLILVVVSALYILLFALYRSRWAEPGAKQQWLSCYLLSLIALHLIAAAIQFFIPDNVILQTTAQYTWALALGFLVLLTAAFEGGITLRYRIMIGGVILWIAAMLVADIAGFDIGTLTVELSKHLAFPESDAAGIVFYAGWLLFTLTLTIGILVSVGKADLPLVSNRLLFWATAVLFALTGQLMLALRQTSFSQIGTILQLIANMALIYAIANPRILDMRGAVRHSIAEAAYVIYTGVFIVIGVVAYHAFVGSGSNGTGVFRIGLVTIALAIAHRAGMVWFRNIIETWLYRGLADPAHTVESYGRAINHILDPNALSHAAATQTSDILGVERGALVAVSEADWTLELEPFEGLGRIEVDALTLDSDDPLARRLIKQEEPLLQYDIDVMPEFSSLSASTRQWLKGMAMALYTPIRRDDELLGLLALGPKKSDEPFRPDEIRFILTLANQTSLALANARLIMDLRNVNREVQKLYEDQQASFTQLQRMDQVKTDFVAIASHELRTPLTQVKGYIDLLQAVQESGDMPPEQMTEIVEHVSEALLQMDAQIDTMLDTTQLDAEALSLSMKPMNLWDAINMAVDPLRDAMGKRNLSIALPGAHKAYVILGDLQRLSQAMTHLLTNAIKFTPDGGQITVTARRREGDRSEPGDVEVVVMDTGVGIDSRDLELVFEKFYRVSDTFLHSTGGTKFMGGGTGLGLSIAKGIINSHGGRIWAQSPGFDPVACPGSSFHLVLPLYIESALPQESISDSVPLHIE